MSAYEDEMGELQKRYPQGWEKPPRSPDQARAQEDILRFGGWLISLALGVVLAIGSVYDKIRR